jgi:hypothetical protein
MTMSTWRSQLSLDLYLTLEAHRPLSWAIKARHIFVCGARGHLRDGSSNQEEV